MVTRWPLEQRIMLQAVAKLIRDVLTVIQGHNPYPPRVQIL